MNIKLYATRKYFILKAFFPKMLLYFYFYIFLIHDVKSGDVAIANCNKAVGQFQRPTVDPSLCAHIDLPACAAIFPYDNANAGATIASHFNP